MKKIHILSKVLFYLTVVLIAAGGLVTSTHSGLSVPDWPLSYGSLTPPMVGGIIFEHSHRMIAGVILLGTLILTYISIVSKEVSTQLKFVASGLLMIVLFQALLGGLTVLLKLPPLVSVAHACLAQLFLSLLVCVSSRTSHRWVSIDTHKQILSLRMWIRVLPVIFFLQLLTGAFLRHTDIYALLAIHIFGALLVVFLTFVILILFKSYKKDPLVKKLYSVITYGILFQFLLGVTAFLCLYTIHLRNDLLTVLIPTIHQTFGAILLASIILLSYRLNYLSQNTKV